MSNHEKLKNVYAIFKFRDVGLHILTRTQPEWVSPFQTKKDVMSPLADIVVFCENLVVVHKNVIHVEEYTIR